MHVEIIDTSGDEVIARGDIYKRGVLSQRYHLNFEKGVLNNPEVGQVYILTPEWVKYMNSINRVAIRGI